MSVKEGRQRLDAALSSSALTQQASIFEITRNQLQRSPPLHLSEQNLENWTHNTLDQEAKAWSSQLASFLEVLRSANGDKTGKLVVTDEPEEVTRGWKLKHENEVMRVMYRKGPEGTPFHTYCVEGIMSGPLENALCVAWEASVYKEWWPQTSVPTFKIIDSRWLNRIRVGQDVCLIRVKVPWPLAAREVVMTAFELEYVEEDLILVVLGTASNINQLNGFATGLSGKEIPPAEENVVRMDVAGGFVFQKMTSDRIFFRTVLDVDIKLDFVPPWIINFISRQLVGLGYKLFQKAVLSVTTGKGRGKNFQRYLNEPLYCRVKTRLSAARAHDQIMDRPLILDKGHKALLTDNEKEQTLQMQVASICNPVTDLRSLKDSNVEGAGLSSRKIVSESENLSEKGDYMPQICSPKEAISAATGLQVPLKAGDESGETVLTAELEDPEVRKALHALDKMIFIVNSLTAEVESGQAILYGKHKKNYPQEELLSFSCFGCASWGGHNLKTDKPLKPEVHNGKAASHSNGMENGHVGGVISGSMDLTVKPDIFDEGKTNRKTKWRSCLPF